MFMLRFSNSRRYRNKIINLNIHSTKHVSIRKQVLLLAKRNTLSRDLRCLSHDCFASDFTFLLHIQDRDEEQLASEKAALIGLFNAITCMPLSIFRANHDGETDSSCFKLNEMLIRYNV